MEKCVIYLRVSTSPQSYVYQYDELKRWCKDNKMSIVKDFGEKVSGYSLTVDRARYEEMKSYVLKNNIKRIICTEISRFGRNSLHTQNEIKFFTDKGINIYFKKEQIWTLSDDPKTKFVLSLYSSLSEMERENYISRSKSGKLSSVMKGKNVYGIFPYGYAKDENKMLIVHPEEAKVIELIYSLGLKGMSLRGIATHLNSLDIPTRHTLSRRVRTLKNNKKVKILWRNNTIRKILHSTIYKGERIYKGEINLKVPAIISPEIWAAVQERFIKNIGYSNKTKYFYLFKSKIFCKKCGLIYSASTRNGVGSYSCSGRKDKGIKCDNGGIGSELIDTQIWKVLFNNKEVFQVLIKNSMDKQDNTETLKQIEFYKSEIKKLEGKKKRDIKIYSDGDYTEDEYRILQMSTKNTQIEYSNKISVLEKSTLRFSPADLYRGIQKLWLSNNFNEKRELIENLIDKVLIFKVDRDDLKQHSQDKIVDIEIYIYGVESPLKLTLTTKSKQVLI